MPRDSGGNYSLPSSYLAVTGQTILASQHNPPLEDIATALTGSLPRNGSAGMQTDLPMGGFKITGMADGVAATDAATVGQSSTAAATAITSAPLKTTPVDADTIPIVDSASSNTMKRLTWANLKALFQPVSAVLTALSGIGTAVSGDLIYSSAAGTWARRAKGSDGQYLGLSGGVPTWGSPTSGLPFTHSYESSAQTLTPGGLLTLAHSLGTQPKLYMVFLKNATAELGYSIGDELAINQSINDAGAQPRGLSLVPDATNLNIRFGTGSQLFYIYRKDTGASALITNANWRLIARAWA